MSHFHKLLISGTFSFCVGWLIFIFSFDNNKASLFSIGEHSSSLSTSLEKSFSGKYEKKQNYTDLSTFLITLQNKKTSFELKNLFYELLENPVTEQNAQRLFLLLKRWGEVAPRQGINVLLEENFPDYWISILLSGWASKDPEAVVQFYEKSSESKIKFNDFILNNLPAIWAKTAPLDAWKWFEKQEFEKTIFYNISKNNLISAIAKMHPDVLPDFIPSLSPEDIENNAFFLNLQLNLSNQGDIERLVALSSEGKNKALAGQIIAKTNGNPKQTTQELELHSEKIQQSVAPIMATSIFSFANCSMEEKAQWILDHVKEPLSHPYLQNRFREWLHENRNESKQWIDSLPSGKIKNELMKLYFAPPIQYE